MKTRLITIFAILISLCGFIGLSNAADNAAKPRGEVFGKSVTEKEYDYIHKIASRFTRTGNTARTDEEINKETWEDIAYLREAASLGIDLKKEEFEETLKKVLSQAGVERGSPDYIKWASREFTCDVPAFERMIRDLSLLDKFYKMKSDPDVTVSEDEIKNKFLNQYNSFESEYIKFDTRSQAEEFAQKVRKDPKLWKETFDAKKPLGQKGSSWINIMALEALIELWQIPRDSAYDILSRKEGDFIVSDFYYGTAVFRLLYKKTADLKDFDEKKSKYYHDMVVTVKKRTIAKDYFDNLLKRANYKDYAEEEKVASKVEDLKNQSLVMLETSKGPIQLRLLPDVAPKACENFVGLIQKGYYNNLIFHRVIKAFMLQGGDPTGTGRGGDSIWKKAFADEFSDDVVFDRPGMLAMANSGPNSNKSQFFITTAPAQWLNKKHTIFGEVISGYDVVQKMENTPTDSSDRPKEELKILKAYIVK